MNFLAHLTLSHGDADLQFGNYIGDFIRGRELLELPPRIQVGVYMHRAIDALTDADPNVRTLNRQFARRHGRYAPVLTDIAFDHALYQSWSRYAELPYGEFKANVYALLLRYAPLAPPRIEGPLRRMVEGDWLRQYTSRPGMSSVFRRFRRRLSRPQYLDGIEATLTDLDPEINRTFDLLFPRLQTLARTYLEPTPTD